MELLPQKPIVIEACLPVELCITTNDEVETPRASVHTMKDDCSLYDLKLVRKSGCKYSFLIPEAMASCGVGYYRVKLWDDCILCETICIRLKRECFIKIVEISEPKIIETCC
jgi:hypothetical protein